MLVPSIDNVRGPFERVTTPDEAVDRLARLYDDATQALRGAVERFLKDGEPPSSATRALFRYPELRLTYAPNGPALSSPRAFAKFSDPATTRPRSRSRRSFAPICSSSSSRWSANTAPRSRSASARRRSPTLT